jgi:hypothetical protein
MKRTFYDHVKDEAYFDEAADPSRLVSSGVVDTVVSEEPTDLDRKLEVGLIATDGQEIDYPGYSRVRIDSDLWQIAGFTQAINGRTIPFPPCGSGGRGKIDAAGLWSNGQCVSRIRLTRSPVVIGEGDCVQFEVGQLQIPLHLLEDLNRL